MSPFVSLKWRLAGAFFLLILVLVSLTGLYLLNWTERYYIESISDDLARESRAIAGLAKASPNDVPDVVAQMGRDLRHRVTIISSNGNVLADSESNFHHMPNHADRPEFRQAMATGQGHSTRYSATLKTKMLYVATAYGAKTRPNGVVRIAEPLSGMDKIMTAIQRTFLFAGLVAMIAAAALSLKLASDITNPIEGIASVTHRLESGEYGARVPAQAKTAGELGELASTFNHMAERLQDNIDKISRQSAQMQTVFDHTDNGMLLVDPESKVRMINPAACRILDIECPNTVEKTLIEGTLNHDLASLVERVRRTQEPAALDIELTSKDEKSVHAYVAPVSSQDGGMDVLVVLHDVTSMRKLDAVRRDFVANVSHELRTPLASIKAMAETIILRSKADPSVAPEFAKSIVAETDRMTLLAEDLLDLTKIESQKAENVFEPLRLRDTVDEVLGRLAGVAEKKSISLKNEVGENEIIQADGSSLIQVLINLVDNATKYTSDGGTVTVLANHGPGHIAIRVIDNGMGVPTQDLPRIFERFYRVDKARSRQSGGTGLGLAIVKHLCEKMGGKVSVKSEVGIGSTFSVFLPLEQNTSDSEQTS